MNTAQIKRIDALEHGLEAANDNFHHLEQEFTALKAVVNRKE